MSKKTNDERNMFSVKVVCIHIQYVESVGAPKPIAIELTEFAI